MAAEREPTHSAISSRLFLSADLVGSTARKQAQGSSTWIGDVLAFYQQFPSHLSEQTAAAESEKQGAVNNFELADPPTLWKAVGDELIYTAEVRDEHDVCVLVDAWIAAMRATEREVLGKAQMDLKGAAWIATFPLPDRAVAVPTDPSVYDSDLEPDVVNRRLLDLYDDGDTSSVRVDYLGPSIDIGFRIAGHAVARKFMLTFEVAWAIAVSRLAKPASQKRMYLEGETQLKGVWGGRGYPLFWLDTGNHHAAQNILDRIGHLTTVTPEDVRELALALKQAGDWPCTLYLPDSTHTEFQRDHEAIEEESRRLEEISDLSGEVPNLGT